ncbi:DUF4247 domain-containing protein [Paenibacillus sp. MBLB4367]|uniref:DUF4247 domain-containing protein n=1 Tax=Paenibacillus sp. MBLB4367 TaxID=3384767 RepID=UPI0039080515
MKRWSWPNVIAYIVVFAVIISAISGLFGSTTSASSYVKDNYPLVDVQGKGKDNAKVYMVENKDVPTVAQELAAQQTPKEKSKDSADQMFLVYSDKIINVQKDPQNSSNTLVEIDSIQYAKEHYDSSFLQGFVTATILQSLFDNDWVSGKKSTQSYRGYTSTPSYQSKTATSTSPPSSKDSQPSTTDRTGSFSSKSGSASSGTKTDSATPKSSDDKASGSSSSPSSSGSSGTFRTNSGSSTGSTSSSSSSSKSSSSSSSSSSSTSRKNDGSTPSYKAPSKPSTSSKSGSFSSKKK